jgi:ABC-type transporter Mla MlaB component
MDSSAVYSMFEEIKEALKQSKDSKQATVPPPSQVDSSALTAIKNLAEHWKKR